MQMATPTDMAVVHRRTYFKPLEAVKDFFEALEQLRSVSSRSTGNEGVVDACHCVSLCGEQMVLCLEQQMKSQNRASEVTQEVLGAFRLSLHRMMQLRIECNELKAYIKELQLAEHGLDARRFSNQTASSGPQAKQRDQRDFVIPGSSPMPRAVSFEDFRKHRDLHLSSKRSTDSASNIRKAKSESDVAMLSLKKKVESFTVDNTRLRTSEKKLLKENVKLTRTCKTLEAERDCAEDRLKIEQTQRDSIEMLRQRNKELEDQLRKLCDTQVLRDREEQEKQRAREEAEEKEGAGSDGGLQQT